MISLKFSIAFLTLLITAVMCQRSPYAGSRPSGYKDRFRPKENDSTADNEIVNRFGQIDLDATQKPPAQGVQIIYGEVNPLNQSPTNQNNLRPEQLSPRPPPPPPPTPSRIPYDAYGDIELVNRLSSLPIDQQPFWFINYQAIEAHRNRTGNNFNTISSRSSFLGK